VPPRAPFIKLPNKFS